jgi:hypothetical protein
MAALALAGCGLGAGPTPGGVGLLVTRDFGAGALRVPSAPRVQGSETVMSLLMRNATVQTRYGGGFVESIDGDSGGRSAAGAPEDWFYYVNGVEAPEGAAQRRVHPGDRIWWDLHDWSQSEGVPAVVGSFPEPFLHGIEGRRLPVRVECSSPRGGACTRVAHALLALGVPAGVSTIAPSDEAQTLRVLVGPWATVRDDPAARSIESGPRASGVYARLSADGRTLTLLDPEGHATRTLTSGAGLIAATRYSGGAPVWVLTGTDAGGVDLAAGAFAEGPLHARFAVALMPPSTVLALPRPSP